MFYSLSSQQCRRAKLSHFQTIYTFPKNWIKSHAWTTSTALVVIAEVVGESPRGRIFALQSFNTSVFRLAIWQSRLLLQIWLASNQLKFLLAVLSLRLLINYRIFWRAQSSSPTTSEGHRLPSPLTLLSLLLSNIFSTVCKLDLSLTFTSAVAFQALGSPILLDSWPYISSLICDHEVHLANRQGTLCELQFWICSSTLQCHFLTQYRQKGQYSIRF